MKYDAVIVGAGVSGLTLAHRLLKQSKKILLLEKNKHTGGVIRTSRFGSFLLEQGPNTVQYNKEEMAVLFNDLELKFVSAAPVSRNRYIVKNNQWEPLPLSPLSLLKTPLFTKKDKLKIITEIFQKGKASEQESLAQTVTRKLGSSFLDYAIDPFVSGIYAGNPQELITRWAFPRLYALEVENGSYFRGAIRKKFSKKNKLLINDIPKEAHPNNQSISFENGLQSFVDALTQAVKPALKTEASIKSWQKKKNQFDVDILVQGQAQKITSEKLFYCGAASQINVFLEKHKPQALVLPQITSADVVQVGIGFHRWQGKPIEGFGLLAPSKEKKSYLGVLFPSSLFSGRAPKGGALLSVFMGGRRAPNWIDASAEEIENNIRFILKADFQTTQSPDMIKIFRYPKAIPQYDKHTEGIRRAISEMEKNEPGLFLAGNVRDGIGFPDRIVQAFRLASSS